MMRCGYKYPVPALLLSPRSVIFGTRIRSQSPFSVLRGVLASTRSSFSSSSSSLVSSDSSSSPSPAPPPSSQEWRETPASDIAILGAGVTGLTTALHLSRLLPNAHITIYEASDRAGGWVDTSDVELLNEHHPSSDLKLEHGPRVIKIPRYSDKSFDYLAFMRTKEMLSNTAPESALLAQGIFEDYESSDLNKYIYYPDHIVALPASGADALGLASRLTLGFPTPPEALFKTLHHDLFNVGRAMLGKGSYPDRNDPYWDMSIGDLVESMCGPDSSLMTMASSMFAGIYGGDVYKLSVRSSNVASSVIHAFLDWHSWASGKSELDMPLLRKDILIPEKDMNFRLRHQDLLQDNESVSHLTGINITFPFGASRFVDAMVDVLQDRPTVTIKLNTPVESLTWAPAQDRVLVKTPANPTPSLHAKVISTLFSHDLAKLTLKQSDQAASSTTYLPSLSETEASTILAVNVAYMTKNLDAQYPGFGYLISPSKVPLSQNPEMALGVLFDSHINQYQRSLEPGVTKFTVLIGGHHWKGIPVEQLPNTAKEAEKLAIAVLHRHLDIPLHVSSVVRHKLCVNCIPQHVVGHRERMARAHNELMAAFNGRLAVAGPSYTRAGVVGALRGGLEIAEAIADRNNKSSSSAHSMLGDTGLKSFVGHERFSSVKKVEWLTEIERLKSIKRNAWGGPWGDWYRGETSEDVIEEEGEMLRRSSSKNDRGKPPLK